MPERRPTERARRKLRQGKSPSTAAGEFVREEIEHVREGKHGARSSRQAIAIGLSKARRAGVRLPRKKGIREPGKRTHPSRRRAAGVTRALKREPRRSASRRALSRQAHRSARQRGRADRRRAARRAARTRRASR
jgi:Family of unknown function (DUF6496)